MDFLASVAISGFFIIPLIIVILYFIKITYKSISFFLIQLLLADISILLWGLAGIPVLLPQEVFTNQDLIIIEEWGVIFGSFGFILLFFIFNNPYFANKQLFFSRTGVVAFGLIIGVKIALLLQNSNAQSIYGLFIANGNLKRYTDPVIQIIVLIAFVFLIIVLAMYSIWQNRFPSYLISNTIKKESIYATVIMAIGILLNYLGLLIPVSMLDIAHLLFLVSRFFITFGFIFITLMIAQNPIIILKEKGNPYQLLENGIVGWILAVNTELGPSPQIVSKKTRFLYQLSEKQLMLFAISSISIVGIGQNFTNTQFSIPFPSKENELTVLCCSFIMYDPLLTDPRRKNTADVVFGIIIPKILINYLGNIMNESFTITKRTGSYKTLQDFIEKIDLEEESFLTLRNLLLQKIT